MYSRSFFELIMRDCERTFIGEGENNGFWFVFEYDSADSAIYRNCDSIGRYICADQ